MRVSLVSVSWFAAQTTAATPAAATKGRGRCRALAVDVWPPVAVSAGASSPVPLHTSQPVLLVLASWYGASRSPVFASEAITVSVQAVWVASEDVDRAFDVGGSYYRIRRRPECHGVRRRRTPPCSTLDRSVCEGCPRQRGRLLLGVTRRDRLRSAPAVPTAHAPRWPRRTVGYSTSRPTGSSGRVAAVQLREPLCYGKSPEADIEIFSCRSRLFRIRGGTSSRAGSPDGNWRDGCERR